MSREIKQIFTYQPEGIPEPYNHFVMERNRNIANVIGEMIGAEVQQGFSQNGFKPEDVYCVPATALTDADAKFLGVTGRKHLYGAVVRADIHSYKSQLHQTLDSKSNIPIGYSARYAAAVRDVVLPGGVFFTTETAATLFGKLTKAGYPVLLKDPAESDFQGQFSVSNETELIKLLSGFENERVLQYGLILEAKLKNPKTISIGQIFFDGETYALYADQTDIKHKGRMKFGGGNIMLARGEIKELAKLTDISGDLDAIEKSETAFEGFGEVDPVGVSRLSFDVVRGELNGRNLSGVTDITARVGGYTPAEVLAIDYLRNNPDTESVRAKSELIYDPRGEHKGVVFLDHKDLKIVASIIR